VTTATQITTDDRPLDEVFGALADSIRRSMIERLTTGPATVSELARPFEISLPAIMRHVRVLEAARLIETHKIGRERHCRMAREPLRDAIAWIVHYGAFWEERLDALEELLARSENEATR
jgi:DNA-binding transcriptional ArsR family regulator